MYAGKNAMSANRAHKWQKVRAREQKCVPRSTGMGMKKVQAINPEFSRFFFSSLSPDEEQSQLFENLQL